jgi:hypothetical protein
VVDSAEMAALANRAIETAEKVSDTQASIVRQQARSRRTLRWLFASVAVDLALSVAMVSLAIAQAHVSAAQARVSAQIHQSQLNACAIGNDFRAGQVRLWDHVIAVSSAPPHETAAERKARLAKVARFRTYVAGHFRPVDCKSLYGPH